MYVVVVGLVLVDWVLVVVDGDFGLIGWYYVEYGVVDGWIVCGYCYLL